jgi:hypothetical protein
MRPKSHAYAIRGCRHILLVTMPLSRPVAGSPCIENIACDSDNFPENSRGKKTKCDRIEVLTSRYPHSGTENDENQHALIFFFSFHCSGLDLSHPSPRSKLLADRGAAGMSLENMY